MKDFGELIDEFGISGVAEILGLPESHIRTMKVRKSIAPEYWPMLIEGARARKITGVTYPTLIAMRSARPERVA